MKILPLLCWLALFAVTTGTPLVVSAQTTLGQKLAGRMLLQVENHGRVWYINTTTQTRYGITADNALDIFRTLALGITDQNLDAIPTNIAGASTEQDSDNDGYSDQTESRHGYNIFGAGRAVFDMAMTKRLKGRLLLQVQDRGRIWYINPVNLQKYEVSKNNILSLFQSLALGIANRDLATIPEALLSSATNVPGTDLVSVQTPPMEPDAEHTLKTAANAIRSNDTQQLLTLVTAEFQPAAVYTMKLLNADSRLVLSSIMSEAQYVAQSDETASYRAAVFFNGEHIAVTFRLQRQPDGSWLLANL